MTEYFKFPKSSNLIEHITTVLGDFKLSARTHTDNNSYAKDRNYIEIKLHDYLKLIEQSKENLNGIFLLSSCQEN